MKVAFISDVHANLAALEAVLSNLANVDQLVFSGDAVGYGDQPQQVCDLLRDSGAVAVKGNHDAMLLGELPVHPDREGLYKTSWTRRQLSDTNLTWLAELPEQAELVVDGQLLTVRHASPWDLTTYLYPDSPLLARATPQDGSTLIVGHTHYPYVRPGHNGLLVNCGSVGFPRGGAPGAQFTLLDTETQSWVQRTLVY